MALRFVGSLTVRAPREQVWAFLVDPHAVSQCLPDVQALEVLGDGRFRAVVRVGVGFIKGNFTVEVAMTDRQPPAHAVLTGHGGGLGSAVDLRSTLDLAETPEGTRLDWQAEVVVSGTLATAGARLLQSTVEKKTTEAFACVKTRLEA